MGLQLANRREKTYNLLQGFNFSITGCIVIMLIKVEKLGTENDDVLFWTSSVWNDEEKET